MIPFIHNATYWAQVMLGASYIGNIRRIERLVDIISRFAVNRGVQRLTFVMVWVVSKVTHRL